ncbi:MAG: nitric oxide reductase activation protein NorD [Sedimenticolaceae bacterium]
MRNWCGASSTKRLHQMAGKAPRGMLAMLENLDELLAKLTLGGLRRWVMWGAQAHQRDLDGQMGYFAFKTESASSILQKERRGTLFVNNQRKLNFYLRALWARVFLMRPTSGDYESRTGLKPCIEDFQIHVPDAYDPFCGIDGIEIYPPAAAHAAAHMVYTRDPISAVQLSQAQMRCIELFEDARVEYLAYSESPGLRKRWLSFLTSESSEEDEVVEIHEAMDLMMRTTRAIMDPDYDDELAVINSIAGDFRGALEQDPYNPRIAWMAGVDFYNKLAEISRIPSVRIMSDWPIAYRDDNRFFWDFDENMFVEHGADYIPATQQQIRKTVSAIEMANEVDCELAGDNFAVHGFAADGRHDVQYCRFTDFGQHYDDAKSQLAGMKGNLSTRMGAALRHAGWHLSEQPAQKRLVLLITDGEPADIDERDPQYLRHDTKKAVEDLAMRGIYTYCLTLDPDADRYVARIFGENNYSIVDNVERLPERLTNVFAALTG